MTRHPQPPSRCRATPLPGVAGRRTWLRQVGVLSVAALLPWPTQAIELPLLRVIRGEQGVMVDFETRFELPPGVAEALKKGVALHFVAQTELIRKRWYWRNKLVAQASRTWRLTYQPLTMSYRVSLGGLSQTYRSLEDALRAIQSGAHWRIGDALSPDDDGENYQLVFSYRLDTDQLPRPLQIGIGSQPEWNLQVERILILTNDAR